jgi:hypothetical protein
MAACVAVALAAMAPARADVLESSPTLPLLGDPYTIPGGACFSGASVCVAGGSFTLTALTSSSASGGTEDFTTNAVATIYLTPAATVTLTGSIEQEVLGRTGLAESGTWTVDLLSLSLSGSLGGYPLTMTLNPSDPSSGTTLIAPDGGDFIVNSFFDVFAELTYDGPNGVLTATPSGIATATNAPEPATLALLAGSLLAMSAVRRLHRQDPPASLPDPAGEVRLRDILRSASA